MPTLINVDELRSILKSTIDAYETNDPFAYMLLTTMFETGLRANEVLEVSRWSLYDANNFVVSLEKGDATRIIAIALIDPILADYYKKGIDNPVYTYSSILWRINKSTPKITCNGDTRRTSAHLFRYFFIKDLYEGGYTIDEIQEIIKHKSKPSTIQYIFDNLYLH